MKAGKRFAVVGSDARQAAAGRALARAGYAVSGAEQVALSDYILLPLPLDESRTPLAELLRAAKPGALALGGRLSVQAKVIAREAGVELYPGELLAVGEEYSDNQCKSTNGGNPTPYDSFNDAYEIFLASVGI